MPGMRPVFATPLHVRESISGSSPLAGSTLAHGTTAVSIDDAPQRLGALPWQACRFPAHPFSPTITQCHDAPSPSTQARGGPALRRAKPNPVCQVPRWLPVRLPCSVTCRSEDKAPPTAALVPWKTGLAREGNWEGGNAAGRSGISGSKGGQLVLIGQLARFNGRALVWLGPGRVSIMSMCFRRLQTPPFFPAPVEKETKPEFPHHPQLPRMSNTLITTSEETGGEDGACHATPSAIPSAMPPSPPYSAPLRIFWPCPMYRLGLLGAVGRPPVVWAT